MAEMDLPDIDLEGRVFIMTGADRGLGRAMSLGLAKKARAWLARTGRSAGKEGTFSDRA